LESKFDLAESHGLPIYYFLVAMVTSQIQQIPRKRGPREQKFIRSKHSHFHHALLYDPAIVQV